ncbi:E3 ubiquitin-protein ligase MARCHF11 [Saccopteryx bilineata]|uniref:E3 ubiquitin-protein ligase MARCHF11 n=1 Tax=Saccopteryx bilineata TaxID=59482 RepID=UPI00338F937B
MSFEGGHSGSRRRGVECGDAEPPPSPPPLPPPPPPLPPGERTSVPAPLRYLPPLPAPPVSPERSAGPDELSAGLVTRRRGTDELPSPPLPPAGQEVSAAGDSAEGPRHLLEAAVSEAAEEKGDPGEPEAGPGGEGERRRAGDQPETRSVCSSRSSSSGDQRTGHQHQHYQPICKICFQGAEQGELLNPCRCDGSVRYTHQLCLLKWISERGSWTCELCCYRYHVIAIKMKQPCQWQSISITLVEKVQMIAVTLGSLFLIASVTWLLWSAFSPYAVWQRKDILFRICYGMYGFMDLVCIGLIFHEGAAVYRVFKRWRAVNLHWDVLNYDKATDIEESSRGESSSSRTLWLPLTALRNRNLVHPTQLTSPRFQCGYVLLHLFNRMRPHEDLSEDNSSGEVVMRVTSV